MKAVLRDYVSAVCGFNRDVRLYLFTAALTFAGALLFGVFFGAPGKGWAVKEEADDRSAVLRHE